MNYDQYHALRFRKEAAIWADESLGYTLELFSAGYIYGAAVDIWVVDRDQAALVQYDPGLFRYQSDNSSLPANLRVGFSGFRIHRPFVQPDPIGEFAVFQGASYFRCRTRGQDYGLSARGLAINTAQPPADEFPVFRSFWILKPAAGAPSITILALLDSVSTSGLYKFVISIADATAMEVSCTLFPRQTISSAGIAPMTTMFYFGPGSAIRGDDPRQRVHDSDGLLILNREEEFIWRPLNNRNRIAFSSFPGTGLKGFGLLQRERRPDRYQDFGYEYLYEGRPTLWMEPLSDWGEGTVELVELPAQKDWFDNIVAFWHPRNPLAPGKSYSFKYRLTWDYDAPVRENIATVTQTLVGASHVHPEMRLFLIDYAGTDGLRLCEGKVASCPDGERNISLSASAGSILNAAILRNELLGGHRIRFEYLPPDGGLEADISCVLMRDGKPASEIWTFRWTA
jgi:glucans biosynthesis protein